MNDVRPVSLEPINSSFHELLDFGFRADMAISVVDARPLKFSITESRLDRERTSVSQRGLLKAAWNSYDSAVIRNRRQNEITYFGIRDQLSGICTVKMEWDEIVFTLSLTRREPVLPLMLALFLVWK